MSWRRWQIIVMISLLLLIIKKGGVFLHFNRNERRKPSPNITANGPSKKLLSVSNNPGVDVAKLEGHFTNKTNSDQNAGHRLASKNSSEQTRHSGSGVSRPFPTRRPMDGAKYVMEKSEFWREIQAVKADHAHLKAEKNERVQSNVRIKIHNSPEEKESERFDGNSIEQIKTDEDEASQEKSLWAHNMPKSGKKMDFSQRLRHNQINNNFQKSKGFKKITLTSAKKTGKRAPVRFSKHETVLFSRKSWCQNAKKEYGIEPYSSFGSATPAARTIWNDYKCNKLLESKLSIVNPIAECDGTNKNTSYPLIAILVAISSPRIHKPTLKDFDITTICLPSLMSSLDCGFRYDIHVGYLAEDSFFDTKEGIDNFKKWYEKEIHGPLEKNGIKVRLFTTRTRSQGHGQATIYSRLASEAYTFGANFLYRIADNIEFQDRWPSEFVNALKSLQSPPLMGVVGPSTGDDSRGLLSLDFVHRSHFEVFPYYYPASLMGGYVEDWMSRIYGHNRTLLSRNVQVVIRKDTPNGKSNSFMPKEKVLRIITESRKELLSWLEQNVPNSTTFDQELQTPVTLKLQPIRPYPPSTYADEDNELLQSVLRDKSLYRQRVTPADRQKWCMRTKREHGIMPYTDWGPNISKSEQILWKEYACNMYFISKKLSKRKISHCSDVNLTLSGAQDELPLIAVMAASTTRKIVEPGVSNIALFTILLPSLVRSLDCGFRYLFVVGYDRGDKFFDTKKGLVKTLSYFDQNVKQKMKQSGIIINLQLIRVANTLKKPGPVFLEMAKAAYASGAEYFYRVNDDTEMLSPWARLFTTALNRLSKPYGVIGPLSTILSRSGKHPENRILTHDFVHRTHMEIFSLNYYPQELTDWWMDDWISLVYGKKRTFISRDASVIHHTATHGKRYMVDFENEKSLDPLIKTGRKKIYEWMQQNNLPSYVLSDFFQTYRDYRKYSFSDISDI